MVLREYLPRKLPEERISSRSISLDFHIGGLSIISTALLGGISLVSARREHLSTLHGILSRKLIFTRVNRRLM